MRYRLVIFDFDGTLADTFPWFVRVFNEMADRYRFRRLEAEEIERLRGLSSRELVKHLGVPAWKLPFIARYARGLKKRDIHTVSLFPGTPALLRGLTDAGVELAMVSSNSEENVRRVLGPENASLIRHYDCGASLFGKRAAFRRVLRRAGVEPADALCVGDEIRDAEAAREAGIPFGAATWGYTTGESLRAQRPAELFDTMEEILRRVTG